MGKTLAESLHQSAGGSLHRMAVSTADAGASPPPPHTTWHSHYNELALQLIASTTTAGSLRVHNINACVFKLNACVLRCISPLYVWGNKAHLIRP